MKIITGLYEKEIITTAYTVQAVIEELERIKKEVKELSPHYEDNRPHRIWDSDVLDTLDKYIKELKGENE